MPDAHKNFAYSTVATAPSPASSGSTLSIQLADAGIWPTPPFNATVWPTGAQPLNSNAEIVRVTKVGGTQTLGPTSPGSATFVQSTDILRVSRVRVPSGGGNVTKISFYCNPGGANAKWRGVIYADNGSGAPAGLVYTSAEVTVASGSGAQWSNTASFSQVVSAGDLWIGYWVSGTGVTIYYDASGGHRDEITPAYSTSGSPPDPFGTPSVADSILLSVNCVLDTGPSGQFSITRAQENSSARSIVVGDQIAATITKKTITDLEPTGLYYVQSYGAVADGVTDDSTAIQAAIDDCTANGGGTVQLMRGQHKINTTLTVKDSVWLRGYGPATDLRGTANPMVQTTSTTNADRMTISDFCGVPTGKGVYLTGAGAYQLGWPRITVENVTFADAGSYAFHIEASTVIECRLINCVSLRAASTGFFINCTDNMLIGCTAGQGTAGGFDVRGGNNKLECCKSYGNTGNGFDLLGAGRHVLAGCETQDNVGAGYYLAGNWNVVDGCLADTNKTSGFDIGGANNIVDGVAMYGGGGSGYVTQVGFRFESGARGNKIRGTTNSGVPVAGDTVGNDVYVVDVNGGGRQSIAYAATVTPDPYFSEIAAVTLTGNITINNPIVKHVGQRLTFELTQDGTGGRTTTFDSFYRTNWTPDTTANRTNVISFEYTGDVWEQISAATGLTARASLGLADNFNRANNPINTGAPVTWVTYNSTGGASWVTNTNQARTSAAAAFSQNFAVVDAGVTDYTVQGTFVAMPQGPGLVWGYTDQNNYNEILINTIYAVVGGNTTTIASGVVNFSAGDVGKIVVRGPNATIYKNGTLQGTWVVPFNLTATKAGFFSSGDNDIFDDFSLS